MSFSNGNGKPADTPPDALQPASPATVTICGPHLGAADDHWATLV